MLRRSHQPFTAEMLKYSNAAPAKVIVVYDLTGSTAAAEGNLFVEKGIDNLIVLTGGEQKSITGCVLRASVPSRCHFHWRRHSSSALLLSIPH